MSTISFELEKKVKIAPHCICILCVRQYKMNSQLNKVAAICALVIVATYVFQGQANPLGIPSYQFGVEVPLYRIKLPAFAIGNILFALSVRWVLEFLSLKCLLMGDDIETGRSTGSDY